MAGEGVCGKAGGHAWQGACMASVVCVAEGACMAATVADGTHPTGMPTNGWIESLPDRQARVRYPRRVKVISL